MDNSVDNVRLNERIRELELENDSCRKKLKELEIETGEIRRSLERYKLIADFAHDWEMWFAPDRSIEYISPSCENLTGYAAGELVNNPGMLDEIIYPADLEDFRRFITDSLNFVDIRSSLNFRILTRTKQIRWCEIKCRAVYDSRGKYLGQRASVNDVTRLMQALGEIKNLSDGKEYDARIRDRYIREIEDKDRELVSQLMVLSNKNETLQYVKSHLNEMIKTSKKEEKPKLTRMVEHINSTLMATDNWENFMLHFERIHPGFFERLQARFPSLTSKDLKLCSYLRLHMTTKEIAGLLNITPQSAEISRVRLRKKLRLTRKDRLADYISKV
ncbi:MAG: PAS domain-containing protein [Bacteroidales bacterium]|jgi:PAS domain S-box-containing protein|nr:PAS domain-containing protein [Bacteroidales bacterium]